VLAKRFRARFHRGHIEPDEPVVFPEGVRLVVTAEEAPEGPVEAEGFDLWAGYDPEKAKAAIRASAGALKGLNREEFLRDLHRAREQDSHGRPTQ